MSFPAPYTGLPGVKLHLLEWAAPHVVRVAFNRPPVNALSTALWKEMHRIFEHLGRDGDVRCVVFNGEGRCFTAGLDLNEQSLSDTLDPSVDIARRAFRMKSHILEFQAAISSIELCEKPVIGAAHGVCYGGAIDLLSACDVRFSASDAVYSIKEVDVGLAADIGTLQRFPKVVGNESWARELALTARVFKPDEALRMGFVSNVVQGSRKEVVDAAVKTASEIASKSPVAIQGTKALMIHARDHSVEEGLRYTAVWNAAMLQTDDLPVAMAAALQKKKGVEFAKL